MTKTVAERSLTFLEKDKKLIIFFAKRYTETEKCKCLHDTFIVRKNVFMKSIFKSKSNESKKTNQTRQI